MTFPPSVLRLQVRSQDQHVRLWLPLFLLWPMMAVVALILAPLAFAAAIILRPKGSIRPLLLAGPRLLGLFFALRGLRVKVESESQLVLISFV